MTGGFVSAFLNDDLYSDSGRTPAWGNGSNGRIVIRNQCRVKRG